MRAKCLTADESCKPLHIDTLTWLGPSTILIGSTIMEDEEEETEDAPMLVLRWIGGSASPTGFELTEFCAHPFTEVQNSIRRYIAPLRHFLMILTLFAILCALVGHDPPQQTDVPAWCGFICPSTNRKDQRGS